jgi:adenosylcobinamide-phosphate synthase
MPAGIPGAWAYRVANTADAMVGYRAGHLEYLGKVPARLDDVLNAVPARLASLALTTAAALTGVDAAGARHSPADHVRTRQPERGMDDVGADSGRRAGDRGRRATRGVAVWTRWYLKVGSPSAAPPKA